MGSSVLPPVPRVPPPQVLFPSGPQSGVSLLIDKYVQRTAGTLSSWLVNIVEVRGEGKVGGCWARLGRCSCRWSGKEFDSPCGLTSTAFS